MATFQTVRAAAVGRALVAGQSSQSHQDQGGEAGGDEGSDGGTESQQMLIGESEPMRRVRERLRRAARSDYTVLVSGESGTGKERAARCASPFNACQGNICTGALRGYP